MKRLYDILVVEDDTLDKITIKRFIEKEGFCNSVEYVQYAKDTRARFEKKRFDIVILDVNLPDGDGLSLARELWIKDNSIITICASGQTDIKTLSNARDSQVTAFIEKPVTMEQLNVAIDIVNKDLNKGLQIGYGFIGEDVA